MKRLNLCIITLAVAAACFVSCKKEENGDGKHFTATIATDAKTILDGSTLKWVSSDKIKIYGTGNTAGIEYTATPRTDDATWADFTSTSDNSVGTPTFSAIYPATRAVSSNVFTIPDEQTYATNQIVDFPMFAQSSNYDLVFKNLCGAVKIRLTPPANTTTPTTITGIKITTNTYINGDYTISDGGNTITLTGSTKNHTNTTTLNCNQTLSSSGNDFYVFLPAGNYTYFKIEIYNNANNICTKTFMSCNENNNATLQVTRSKYTYMSFSDITFSTPPPQGALSGLFTYDDSGHQLRFSHGILALQKFNTNPITTGDYYMVSQQYLDRDNGDVRADYCTFGWSTRATTSPTLSNADNTVAWQSIGKDHIRFIAFDNYRKAYFQNLGKPHWHSYAMVKVEGKPGLLLLPDHFFWPWDNIQQPSVFDGTPGSSDRLVNYTGNNWRTLEEAGCVFLKGEETSNGIRYWTKNEKNSTSAYYYSIFGYSIPGLGSYSDTKTNGKRIRYVLYVN